MSNKKSNLARPLAPEEIGRSMHVVVLYEIHQYLPCCFGETTRSTEPVRIRWLPDAPVLLEVIEVCLPFVFARDPDGDIVTLDVRRHRLGRVRGPYANRIRKAQRESSRNS